MISAIRSVPGGGSGGSPDSFSLGGTGTAGVVGTGASCPVVVGTAADTVANAGSAGSRLHPLSFSSSFVDDNNDDDDSHLSRSNFLPATIPAPTPTDRAEDTSAAVRRH